MANDFELRLSKLEHNFEEYMEILVQWLDEHRKDMREHRAESAVRFEQAEKRIEQNDG